MNKQTKTRRKIQNIYNLTKDWFSDCINLQLTTNIPITKDRRFMQTFHKDRHTNTH